MRRNFKPVTINTLFKQSHRFGKEWTLTSFRKELETRLFGYLKFKLYNLHESDILVGQLEHGRLQLIISSALWAHAIRLETPKLIQYLNETQFRHRPMDWVPLNTIEVRINQLNHALNSNDSSSFYWQRDVKQDSDSIRTQRKQQRGLTEHIETLIMNSATQMPDGALKAALMKLSRGRETPSNGQFREQGN